MFDERELLTGGRVCACNAQQKQGHRRLKRLGQTWGTGHRAQGRSSSLCSGRLVGWTGVVSRIGRGTYWIIGRAQTGETETRLGTLVRMEDVLLREVELDEC